MSSVKTKDGNQPGQQVTGKENTAELIPRPASTASAAAGTVQTHSFLSESAAASIRAANELFKQQGNLKSMFSMSPMVERTAHEALRQADAARRQADESFDRLIKSLGAAQGLEMAKHKANVAAVASKELLDRQLEITKTIDTNLKAALVAITQSMTYDRERDVEIAEAARQRDRTQSRRFF